MIYFEVLHSISEVCEIGDRYDTWSKVKIGLIIRRIFLISYERSHQKIGFGCCHYVYYPIHKRSSTRTCVVKIT